MGLFLKISLINEGGLLHKLKSTVTKKHEPKLDEKLHETAAQIKKDVLKKGQ
jgi:predicted glycoside hydrolase/deacetylase ChbG (UPF0249 family)